MSAEQAGRPSGYGALSPDRPLVLIGAGNMGGAMLEGWLAASIPSQALVVIDPDPVERAAFDRPGLRVYRTVPDALVAGALVLAVKPQLYREVAPALTPLRDRHTLLVSVMAGITTQTLVELGPGPVVRAIPNTPASVGKGMTVAFARDAHDADIALADKLLRSTGSARWVPREDLIDAATAVSGSGPAYVFHMVEALAAAGEAAGLEAETAREMARHTVIGAGALLERSDLDPAALRRNVTSPGGTTAAALSVLMGDDALTRLMTETVAAAAARSRQLGS